MEKMRIEKVDTAKLKIKVPAINFSFCSQEKLVKMVEFAQMRVEAAQSAENEARKVLQWG